MSFTEGSESAQTTMLVSNDEQIELLLFGSDSMQNLPSFAWLAKAFDDNQVATLSKLIRSEQGEQDSLICSCFGITKKAIASGIKAGAKDVYELGAQLGCGSKCGSCKPELSAMLQTRVVGDTITKTKTSLKLNTHQ